ncbi:UNVERIFIED_CONTAM: hypothetical protein RMT77_013533 [Armadillidium vulgare]
MIILKRIRNFKLFKLLICFLLGVFFYLKFFIYYDGPSYDTERNVEEWKTILAWTDFFSSRDIWKKVFRRLTNGECEEYKCRLSLNQNDLPFADAVLFNAFDMRSDDSPFKPFVNSYPLPTRVNEDQIFVFYSTEPPTRLDEKFFKENRNFFNWTMSYRKDSDIVDSFGMVKKIKDRRQMKKLSLEELKSKKMAIWIVSYCSRKDLLAREVLVKELQKYIEVDIFGGCGTTCDRDTGLNLVGRNFGKAACDQKIQHYAFYLALENSLCKDYVTEKVFKAWKTGVIPVVLGSTNYSTFAPPNSFIDSSSFSSIEELAKHMKYVVSNPQIYNSYLEWGEDYDIEMGCPYNCFVCELCKALHDPKKVKRNVDIYDWFIKQSFCQQRNV